MYDYGQVEIGCAHIVIWEGVEGESDFYFYLWDGTVASKQTTEALFDFDGFYFYNEK